MVRTICLSQADAAYPCRLSTLANEAPDVLYARGDTAVLGSPRQVVAIVGSRAASGGGMDAAQLLGHDLAMRGVMVLSGGALGIDAAAHAGALASKGHTVAVLAGGLGAPYPARNWPLFERMINGGGALVSSYPPASRPRRWQFVRRNRLIAAWADAVVVVEASGRSGALYTARAACEFGRVLGAMPGTLGCERLLANGAAIVQTAEDVCAALAGTPRMPERTLPATGTASASVLAQLECADGLDTDELARRTGLPTREVTRALVGLELEGLAIVLPGHAYVRSSLATELMVE